MARKFILENLMKLAQGIGANPSKFMGTKTNISFLGKGPTKNPLFQRPLAGIDQASMKQLGPGMVPAVEDAMGFATAGKLNDIQLKILTENLRGINKVLNPPKLPSAKIMTLPQRGEGIGSLKGVDPRETILPMQRSTFQSALPGPGFASDAYTTSMLNAKTRWSRSIARQILQQDTRLKLKPEELYSLRTGAKGVDPLELMKKYYGRSVGNLDEFLDYAEIRNPDAIKDIARRVLSEVELIPQFAHGGLARILEV
tara:strand:+ start:1007 stop:1774 length:768 start_codon:yes stop_codon:yes gene_type:complete